MRELDELLGWLDAARGGAGRLVLCVGEPGIGKTRLAEELAGVALASGAAVAWGRCLEAEGAPPFWLWRQVLRSLGGDPETVFATVQEVHTAYREELGPRERAALLSWVGFSATFATVRAITYSIRRGTGPFRNLSVGGAHLHHYLWGIALLSGVGAVAVHGEDNTRRHPAVALSYGAGIALIVDEFALLLDLQDVYWAKQGRVSVDLGVGLVAAGGTTFSAIPILQRLAHNRRR